MRCPTCGKRVDPKQQTCSYCGGLVTDAYLARGESGPTASPSKTGAFPPSEIPPDLELLEAEEVEAEGAEEAGERPTASPTIPLPAPRPRVLSLIRFLFPLLILLIPLLNFLLRDSSFRFRSPQDPVLREAIFCEDVVGGLPVNPKAVFSLRRDRQIVLYNRWRGVRGRHAYSLRWYPPGETLKPASTAVVRYREGRRGFSNYTFLPLEPGMPLGQWRVEIYLDEQVRARLSFELRE